MKGSLVDGHPQIFNKSWMSADTYPDKSRMQTLYVYNFKNYEMVKIAELFHSLRFDSSNRCDLHPRVSQDFKYLTVDSVFQGKREVIIFDISKLF